MQRIEIIGHLAKDAVRVEGQNGGNPFMSFTVICNERRGEDEVKTAYEACTIIVCGDSRINVHSDIQ